MSEPNDQGRRTRTQKLNQRDTEQVRNERRNSERATVANDLADWPVTNADWRSRGATQGNPNKRKGGGKMPTSPQELQIWLQNGGWKLVAGLAAFCIVLLIALLAMSRNEQRSAGGFGEETAATSETLADTGVGNDPVVRDLSLTPSPIPLPTQAPVVAQFFVVINTAGQGLNLRADHQVASEILALYADGTRLEQIGDDFVGPDRLWRNVRGPDGREGWVAADFLQEAP
jgi:hypothetical protein